MNKRHYEHTLPNIRGSLSNTYEQKNKRTKEQKNKRTKGKGQKDSGKNVRELLPDVWKLEKSNTNTIGV